jgi:hypothetical protein
VHTVIRYYTGVPGLANDLKKNAKEIENVISTIPGFIAYYMIDSADGITSITVCENRNGCDESTKRAANWLKQNMPNLKATPAQIINGEVTFKFANKSIQV